MAIYKLFPTKDATIYSEYPYKNTGLDEILETSCLIDTSGAPQTSRFLVQFSQNEIEYVFNNLITGIYSASFKCYVANINGLSTDTIIQIFPISGSWDMGTGRYLYDPEYSNGTSWYWQDLSGSQRWATSSFSSMVTASWSGSAIGGGTWYSNYSASYQTFNYRSPQDIDIDITQAVIDWYTGDIDNKGLIIKQQLEWYRNINYQPSFKYFSIDTHTIYPPCLEFKWVDFSWNTGSSSTTIIDNDNIVITLEENPNIFYPDSINKFRIYSRPEYPARTFQTSSIYTTNYYLPTSSYYSIKDLDTNETIIDFDTSFTKISADATSNYFKLWMNGLEPERQYKILIKTILNGETLILDNDYYFKIINR